MTKKITLLPLVTFFALGSISCDNWKMPKMTMPEMKMPQVLKEEPPESMVRKRIAAVLKAQDDIAFYRELAGLLQVCRNLGWEDRRLLTEIVEYQSQLSGEQDLARYSRLLETLRIARPSIVHVAAPRLESTDAGKRELTVRLLRWAAPPDPAGRVDFSHFRPYLDAHASQPPVKLVLWMYEQDPAAALWQLAAVYGPTLPEPQRQELLFAEHVVSEILWQRAQGLLASGQFEAELNRQIDKLAQLQPWWVRTYVATVLANNPKLRTPKIMDILAKDPHPVVNAAVERIK